MDSFVIQMPKARSNDQRNEQEPTDGPAPERPPKRLKRDTGENLASERAEDSSAGEETGEYYGSTLSQENTRPRSRVTDVENVLPPTQTDDHAIEEYELAASSQASSHGGGSNGKPRPQWVKGKSSIYVDAFNLALDTVLEEESQLFDEREIEVFRQWRDLKYESQFL